MKGSKGLNDISKDSFVSSKLLYRKKVSSTKLDVRGKNLTLKGHLIEFYSNDTKC